MDELKEICLVWVKETRQLHSIAIWDEDSDKYYSPEAGGFIDLNKNLDIFYYERILWEDLRLRII